MMFAIRFVSVVHEKFAFDEIQVNVGRGSMFEWPFQGKRPWIVLPLSVATISSGKLRMILCARFLNLWLRYMPFSFDNIDNLLRQGCKGAFMIVGLESGVPSRPHGTSHMDAAWMPLQGRILRVPRPSQAWLPGSYKRVKGRSHTVEKRISTLPHKPHGFQVFAYCCM